MLVILLICLLNTTFTQDFNAMREEMVKSQIIRRGIKHLPTIEAMRVVDRHLYVPDELQPFAYEDRPLPIGNQQTISQPYIVAYMTEMLDLKPTDKVLEIGTGSGYQAAILAEIVSEVYTIEIIGSLGKRAEATLKNQGYSNIYCRIGDGFHGWKEKHPFDAIIMTAAPSEIPEALINQLNEGGKMIAPIQVKQQQYLTLYLKKNGKLMSKRLIAVRFVPFTRSDN